MTNNKLPSHEVFFVKQGKDAADKSVWLKVGAAWANEDGEGFNLQLDLIPVGSGRLTMRKPKAKAEADSAK